MPQLQVKPHPMSHTNAHHMAHVHPHRETSNEMQAVEFDVLGLVVFCVTQSHTPVT